jgi:hypothetical protein
MKRKLALALAVSLVIPAGGFPQATPAGPAPDIAVLQLKVMEGEGGVHPAGTRTASAVVVQVSDETGRPVDGATVSFRLPTDGATGTFESGLPTEVFVTGKDGKASVTGIRWGKTAGAARLRITAVKGDVRAGIFSSQYVSEPLPAGSKGSELTRPTASKSRGRWVMFAVVAAGAAAGGLALGLSGSAKTSGQTTSQTSTALDIGVPSIQVGKP